MPASSPLVSDGSNALLSSTRDKSGTAPSVSRRERALNKGDDGDGATSAAV
jgi:hypothetical protein